MQSRLLDSVVSIADAVDVPLAVGQHGVHAIVDDDRDFLSAFIDAGHVSDNTRAACSATNTDWFGGICIQWLYCIHGMGGPLC